MTRPKHSHFWTERKPQRCSGRRALFALLILLIVATAGAAEIRIVNCDAPVQSRKRGIGVNSLSAADFRALAPGVSWYYNWSTSPLTKPADVEMEFLPMIWNGVSGSQTALSSYLAAGNRPWRVLALNEPNLTLQANMTPLSSANTLKQVRAICDPYNIPVIGPHMAIGTAPNQSITAYDPIQGSNVTYTFQQPFLDAVLYYCGATTPAGMATHSYGNFGEITWILNTMRTAYPTQTVWMTEFCPWGAPNDAAVLATMIPAVDFCERTPWVEGYAWFMSRISGDPYNSLLGNSGALTAAGQVYVQMPVHDPDLYYRIPGRLQAERYVAINQTEISPTTDAEGMADMRSVAGGSTLDCNIQVDAAGAYPLSFRVSGATGQIRVFKNGTFLGAANATQTGWSTVSTTVALETGPQTLRFMFMSSGQRLNWMEFGGISPPPAPTDLSGTANGNQVQLTWAASPGATNYNIKRSTSVGGTYTSIDTSATNSYTDTGLIIGNTYYYVVSAGNALGESADSAPTVVTVTAAPVNLALNKPVTVSSVENASLSGANAVDGNSATRWSSAFSDPQWIYVDLQDSSTITRVKLNWEAAYGRSYQIQVASNAVNWTTIYSTTSGTAGVADLTVSGTGRYVRVYGTARGTTYGYSLWDFEVYGTIVPAYEPPSLGGASVANGQFGFWIYGDTGPDYVVQTSTNLLDWAAASTISSPAMPCFWSDTNAPSQPGTYYRVRLIP